MLGITRRWSHGEPKLFLQKREENLRSATLQSFQLIGELLVLYARMLFSLVEATVKMLFPAREKSLAEETILITGTGHGIGRELVIKLASEGATVVGWDISDKGNAETYKILKDLNLHRKVTFYKCDVTNRDEVFNLAAKVDKEVGWVSILVNNAGVMTCKPLEEHSSEAIERIFSVNVLANFWTVQAFLPKMKARNKGHIVSMSSMCGIRTLQYAVPYSSSKFAVRGLMQALHEELRHDESTNNIKLTTVFPIMVNTGLAPKLKIRFPRLIKLLEPADVAEQVTTAIKRDTFEISLPKGLLQADTFSRLLPRRLVHCFLDFMDTGVYPE